MSLGLCEHPFGQFAIGRDSLQSMLDYQLVDPTRPFSQRAIMRPPLPSVGKQGPALDGFHERGCSPRSNRPGRLSTR